MVSSDLAGYCPVLLRIHTGLTRGTVFMCPFTKRSQGAYLAPGPPREANQRGKVEDSPVQLCGIFAAHGEGCQFLEVGIVPYVGELPWAEDPLEYPGHVGVEQRLGLAVYEHENSVRDVLADAGQLLDLLAGAWEPPPTLNHLLGQGLDRGGPSPPEADGLQEDLQLLCACAAQAPPRREFPEELGKERRDDLGPCPLEEDLGNDLLVIGGRSAPPGEMPSINFVPAK